MATRQHAEYLQGFRRVAMALRAGVFAFFTALHGTQSHLCTYLLPISVPSVSLCRIPPFPKLFSPLHPSFAI